MSCLRLNAKFQSLYTSKNRYFVLSGGRAGAKSFGLGTFVADLTYEPGHKILYTRQTMKSAEDSVIPEFLEKVEVFEETGHIKNCTKHFKQLKHKDNVVNTVTQSEILFRGIRTSAGNQTAALKSLQGITTWIIEEAEELQDEDTFDKIDNSLRMLGKHLRVIIIWNPSNKKHFLWKRFFQQPGVKYDFTGEKDGVTYIYTSYLENKHNLDHSFLTKAEKVKKNRPKRYLHIYKGAPLDESEHALWKQSTMIEPYRVHDYPELKRIVVSIDPNVTSTKNSDEAGIIVSGEDFQKHYYVIEDASGRHSPAEWARISVGLFKKYRANRIIAESNNGGDLVKMVIKNVDKNIPVKLVRASRGKLTRAEPVAELYEDGKVHHVGFFGDLEDQMCSYVGGTDSPDRMDAVVWGITELSQNELSEPNIRLL